MQFRFAKQEPRSPCLRQRQAGEVDRLEHHPRPAQALQAVFEGMPDLVGRTQRGQVRRHCEARRQARAGSVCRGGRRIDGQDAERRGDILDAARQDADVVQQAAQHRQAVDQQRASKLGLEPTTPQ